MLASPGVGPRVFERLLKSTRIGYHRLQSERTVSAW